MTSKPEKITLKEPCRKAPGPRGLPVIGVLYRMPKAPLNLLMEVATKFEDIAYLGRARSQEFYLLNRPEYCKYVFQDNHKNYLRGSQGDFLKPLLGDGLATSEGNFWLTHRRLMQPAFHKRILRTMISTMTDEISNTLTKWEGFAISGQSLDISKETVDLTVRIIIKTMCSREVLEEPEKIEVALNEVLNFLYPRQFTPISVPLNWPTPKNKRYHVALKSIHEMVERVIDERYENQLDAGDLLSMLVLARDPQTGEGMSRAQLHDELLTILMAGYETTSSALNWLWYLLSEHPHVAAKLQEEADTVLNGRIPVMEDLSSLKYTEMVFNEALRLYPPIWLNARVCQMDDEIGGYFIPENACVFMSPYVMHRHPEYWEHPLNFDPERFSLEKSAGRPRFAFQPFGGGPRLCIGKHLAEMEAKLTIAMIAQSYSLQLAPNQEIIPKPDLTLRTRHGLQMTIHKRE